MKNENSSTGLALSRRNFLQISAGAIAGMAIMSVPKLSFAVQSKIKPTSLTNCPTDPILAAKSSAMINDASTKIYDFVKKINDTTLRTMVDNIIKTPAPTLMHRYQTTNAIQEVYQKLFHEGLVDSSKIQWNTLFPKCENPNKAPQPFISAPGSGYGSHHAYPGGLATHTATNVCIADAICSIYKDVYNYNVDYDVAIAAELLHDLAKPWVFQWNQDGSCLNELPIAGTGAHHVLSIAESIYRGLPAEVITAQACAHTHPGTPQDEAAVVGWIKAASIIAGKNPISLGLLSKDGMTIPTPHKQEGYITHLADHDFVLSVPASQQSVKLLKEVAKTTYRMNDAELNSIKFNKFRNYIAAQVSFMQIHNCMASNNPLGDVTTLVKQIITK